MIIFFRSGCQGGRGGGEKMVGKTDPVAGEPTRGGFSRNGI
jgi:hypothetical protein